MLLRTVHIIPFFSRVSWSAGGFLQLAAAAFAGVLAASSAAYAAAPSLPDLIEQVSPSVVGVGAIYPRRQPNRASDPVLYSGTGFVVGNGRQVITNYHVLPRKLDVKGKQQLAVFSGRGAYSRAHVARIVRTDEEHDLALLEISGAPLPALKLGDSDSVREGQEIAFTGFPIGAVLGLYPATHRGIVSVITPIARKMENARDLSAIQMRRMRNPYNVFQLDAVAFPGNSGSPMFELQSGSVIGVINSVIVKESRETAITDPSGISYAIPARFVARLLQAR